MEVTSNWDVPRGDRPAAVRAINEFFQSNFTYSTWQRLPDIRPSTNSTPLNLFLTRTHSGHCEYFATATVLLLRKLGVPARYAVGYAVHEKSGGEYVVRLRDAHAWCLVWNEKARNWQDFDTTPASWIDEEENENASPFQSLSDAWSWLGFQFSKFRWGQSNLRQYMVLSLFPVLGLLIYQVFFRQRRKRGRSRNGKGEFVDWPGMDSEFYRVEKKLAEHGAVRRSNEGLADWLQRTLRDPEYTDLADPLRDLLRLHYRYRFDPAGITPEDRARLRSSVETCLEKLDSTGKQTQTR
ncbi:MAG TPA: transglutaminase domain-containing protein, partial [Candidatus Paceibacterota bacterium]|nr:transglutaminase domain-containing protein [Candidatus Paceibacterota bacterium]